MILLSTVNNSLMLSFCNSRHELLSLFDLAQRVGSVTLPMAQTLEIVKAESVSDRHVMLQSNTCCPLQMSSSATCSKSRPSFCFQAASPSHQLNIKFQVSLERTVNSFWAENNRFGVLVSVLQHSTPQKKLWPAQTCDNVGLCAMSPHLRKCVTGSIALVVSYSLLAVSPLLL